MQDLTYHRPLSVAAAVSLLSSQGARPLAGGTDLVPQLREGRRTTSDIIDVKRVAGLIGIEVHADGGVTIGAATTASAIAGHAHIRSHFPAVAAACGMIGSWQIQNRASLGGNICNAAPSADGIPPLLCAATTARIATPSGLREVPLETLFAGPGRIHLAAGELLVALHLPPPGPRSAAAYLRFTPRREMDIAIAGAGAWLQLDAHGQIARARIALASVAPTPIRVPAAESALLGRTPAPAALQTAAVAAQNAASPISDTRGSADYRRHLVGVLTKRALAACLAILDVSIPVP